MANKEKEVRIVLTMPRRLVNEIEDYRFAHRLLSRAAAIRELIKKGLHAEPPSRKSPPNA